MSHTNSVKSQMTNTSCLLAAAAKHGFTHTGVGKHQLYDGKKVEGHAFSLPGWNQKVVVDAKGDTHYDNYGGRWGEQIQLDKLAQRYAAEVAAEEAARNGYIYNETTRENGDIEVEMMQLAGAE